MQKQGEEFHKAYFLLLHKNPIQILGVIVMHFAECKDSFVSRPRNKMYRASTVTAMECHSATTVAYCSTVKCSERHCQLVSSYVQGLHCNKWRAATAVKKKKRRKAFLMFLPPKDLIV